MIDHVLGPFTRFASYQDVLKREGASTPGDVALVGTEVEVLAGLDALESSGATDFAATEFVSNGDEAEATRELLRVACGAPAASA